MFVHMVVSDAINIDSEDYQEKTSFVKKKVFKQIQIIHKFHKKKLKVSPSKQKFCPKKKKYVKKKVLQVPQKSQKKGTPNKGFALSQKIHPKTMFHQ